MGLFLSRFDRRALDSFGFTGFRQAYNVLGYSVGILPKSIQNYRDEFDPYFPNPRQGWRHRELRDFCRDLNERTKDLSFDDFKSLVQSFIDGDDFETTQASDSSSPSVTNRIITGIAAEKYFVMNYPNIDVFHDYTHKDTTHMGCGYDFKLSSGLRNYYVEVKGLNDMNGNVLMTDKEYRVAESLKDLYCLFVVRNFRNVPEHQFFFNPLSYSSLSFERQERPIIQVSYSAKIR